MAVLSKRIREVKYPVDSPYLTIPFLGFEVAPLRNTKHPIDLPFMAGTAPLCPPAPRSSEINERGRITSVKYEEVERIYDWGA